MVKSAPNSPEPAAFRINKTNKVYAENSNPGLCRTQVKYLHKLPNKSPKLKKLFQLKKRRVNKRDQRRHSDSPSLDIQGPDPLSNLKQIKCLNDNGVKSSLTRLNVIDDQEHAFTDSEVDMKHDHVNKANGANLADVVLNLLKSKRQVGYKTVQGDENDLEKQFADIPIANLHEITTESCDINRTGCKLKESGDMGSGKRGNSLDSRGSKRPHSKYDPDQESSNKLKDQNRTFTSYINPPKIILTNDSDRLLR